MHFDLRPRFSPMRPTVVALRGLMKLEIIIR